jgi:hypothetical protein
VSAAWRAGPWRILGARELFELRCAELEVRADAASKQKGPEPLGDFQTYFKGSALRLRPALRHALRRAVGLGIPRLNEFQNLTWLSANGFAAVRPLLAGVRLETGLPRYQFLFTELVPATPTLAEFLRAEPAAHELRSALLLSLARDLARLHARGFVHRDLFPRNLLARTSAPAPHCVFLDAWRGGPAPGLRGPEHDLGCFFLDGAELLAPDEQRLFLARYQEESLRAGRHLPQDWLARLVRARAGVFRRESVRRKGLAAIWKIPGPT